MVNLRNVLLWVVALPMVDPSAAACEPRGTRQIRVEGTIAAVQQDRVGISMGRRTETLLITERTRILQGRAEVDATSLRSGDRIVAQAVRLKSGELEAREIRTTDPVERTPSNSGPAGGGHKH